MAPLPNKTSFFSVMDIAHQAFLNDGTDYPSAIADIILKHPSWKHDWESSRAESLADVLGPSSSLSPEHQGGRHRTPRRTTAATSFPAHAPLTPKFKNKVMAALQRERVPQAWIPVLVRTHLRMVSFQDSF